MKQKFLEHIKQTAQENPARILFPEVNDERTLHAVVKIAEEGTAVPMLLGNREKIKEKFSQLGLSPDLERFEYLDHEDDELRERLSARFLELRKNKGMTQELADETMKNFNYFAVMALQEGLCDGIISGATSPTSETLRPALQVIKTKEPFHKVSAFFFMVLESRVLLFADCAVNIEPNSHELADIAIDTAETAKRFGITPKIAMLSFSTNGSAKHPNVDKIHEATAMVNHRRPDLICDGEMQVDAALVPEVSQRKYPNAKVKGDANILIFPNLEAANISYKLVERLAGAHAIGPILQGLQKPVNDLSRGCSVEDIVNLAAITTLEARSVNYMT